MLFCLPVTLKIISNIVEKYLWHLYFCLSGRMLSVISSVHALNFLNLESHVTGICVSSWYNTFFFNIKSPTKTQNNSVTLWYVGKYYFQFMLMILHYFKQNENGMNYWGLLQHPSYKIWVALDLLSFKCVDIGFIHIQFHKSLIRWSE